MTIIAGRLGEFWAGFAAVPPVLTGVDAGATGGTANANPLNTIWTAVGSIPVFAGGIRACASLVDFSVSGNVDELETTVHNDAPGGASPSNPNHGTARTYIPNFHDETADLSMRYDDADSCQEALLISAFNSLLFHFWYIPEGGDTFAGATKCIWGDAFATSFNPSSPLDDVTSVDFSLRLSGTAYDTNLVANVPP